MQSRFEVFMLTQRCLPLTIHEHNEYRRIKQALNKGIAGIFFVSYFSLNLTVILNINKAFSKFARRNCMDIPDEINLIETGGHPSHPDSFAPDIYRVY
jgi:hypothetical protein